MATIVALGPLHVAEELEELAVAAGRARHRGAPLIGAEPALLDPALAGDRGRAHPDRQGARLEGREALVAQADRVALAGGDVLVDLVVHHDAHRAARQVVGRARAHQSQEAAREGLVAQRLFGRARLARTHQLAQHGRGFDQRADALLGEPLGRRVLRLHHEHGARVEVGEVAEDVLQERRLQELGAHHGGEHPHARLGDGEHRPARDLGGGRLEPAGPGARLLCQHAVGVGPVGDADARRRRPALASRGEEAFSLPCRRRTPP